MHDFYYSRLLNDPTKFQPRSGNRCVEFVLSEVSSIHQLRQRHTDCSKTDVCPVLNEREIEEPAIQDWVCLDHIDAGFPEGRWQQRPHLRLLIGSPEQHQGDAEILPLPL